MVASVRGEINGSKKGSIGWGDAKRIGLNVLWVMLAAAATYGLAHVADIPHQNNPTVMLMITAFTALLQFAQKFFSDTRNVPVVGSQCTTTVDSSQNFR
jgi:hypothetical protein